MPDRFEVMRLILAGPNAAASADAAGSDAAAAASGKGWAGLAGGAAFRLDVALGGSDSRRRAAMRAAGKAAAVGGRAAAAFAGARRCRLYARTIPHTICCDRGAMAPRGCMQGVTCTTAWSVASAARPPSRPLLPLHRRPAGGGELRGAQRGGRDGGAGGRGGPAGREGGCVRSPGRQWHGCGMTWCARRGD
jgi:hypothetical protein